MKRVFSGIQPTGTLHLGNYLGAIKQWVELQNKVDESIFCVVDLHAITVERDPKLKDDILNVAAWYLACGVDIKKSKIFVQSTRPEHAELAWILNCFSTMGELGRMTQFKEKTQKLGEDLRGPFKKILKDEFIRIIKENKKVLINEIPEMVEEAYKKNKGFFDKATNDMASVGLFDYPILMAADILLYQSTDVPVGIDQKQHVELARDLAIRFNSKYSGVFTVPEPVIREDVQRVRALDNPLKKMAKSAGSEYNYITLGDSPEIVRKKISRAVTDSGDEIVARDDKPAMTNLLNIFSGVSGRDIKSLEADFKGVGYGDFKKALAEEIILFLEPKQAMYKEIIADKDKLRKLLQGGSEAVAPIAKKTLDEVKKKIGLGI